LSASPQVEQDLDAGFLGQLGAALRAFQEAGVLLAARPAGHGQPADQQQHRGVQLPGTADVLPHFPQQVVPLGRVHHGDRHLFPSGNGADEVDSQPEGSKKLVDAGDIGIRPAAVLTDQLDRLNPGARRRLQLVLEGTFQGPQHYRGRNLRLLRGRGLRLSGGGQQGSGGRLEKDPSSHHHAVRIAAPGAAVKRSGDGRAVLF